MKINTTVTVGICAYHSQNLIAGLLQSLINQKIDGFQFKRILVHCDQSGDLTAQITKDWIKKNNCQKLVKIIKPRQKLGFAGSFRQIIKNTNSDIAIVLNDDIKISQKNFISQIAQAFNQDQNLGLVAVHLQQLPPRTFVENSVNISIKAYEKIRLSVNQGNNIYSCDGKVLVLSKPFYKKIIWPKDLSLLGNVDAYLYLACISKKFKFRFLNKVLVWHSCPSTVSDYIAWTSRNNSNYFLLQKTFGDLVKKEYYLPKKILWQRKLEQIFKNPWECLFLFGTSFYIRIQSQKQSLNFNPKWESLMTSKYIN